MKKQQQGPNPQEILGSKTLLDHFSKAQENLMTHFRHMEIVNQGTNKGNARETIVADFLKANLPSLVDLYSGEIVDHNDRKSGQIDIIVQAFSSPKIHLTNYVHIALADNVLATIEVKSNLSTGSLNKNNHLKLALDSFRQIKSLSRSYNLIGIHESHEDHTNTPCILFAYSGPELKTLILKLIEYGKKEHLDFDAFAPDLVVVLDKNYVIARNTGWVYPKKGKVPFLKGPERYTALTSLFVYLTKIIEVWNAKPNQTKFQNYLQLPKK